jgi:hypothetical protein
LSGAILDMRFNTAAFQAGMRLLGRDLNKKIDRALFKTGVEMLADFSNEAPKPPIDLGDLRGSGAVQVAGGSPIQGMLDAGSGPRKRKKQNSKLLPPPQEGLKPRTVRVSFNTEYSAPLHENPDWKPNEESEQREPGQIGYKWMAKKKEKNGTKYRNHAGEFLREELGL